MLAAALVLLAAPAWADRVTALSPIPLKPGVNIVPHLAPDGSTGLIVEGWRDNGNAHGYHLIMVLVGDGAGGWNVARVEGGANDPGTDTIRDDPHTGEDVVRAVTLARGMVDGAPATLLLMATRDLAASGAIPDPSDVTFEMYRLVEAPDVGTTPVHFAIRERTVVGAHSCNAELARSRWFHLPLPADYAGPPTPDGCLTPTPSPARP